MKWPKDRKKAFRWAAEAFGTQYNERTERQKFLTRLGICRLLCELTNSSVGSIQISNIGHKMRVPSAYWWPHRDSTGWTPSCDKQRSDFCSLMAVLSKKEFEELSEKKT